MCQQLAYPRMDRVYCKHESGITQFAVGGIGPGPVSAFSSDTATVHNNIDSAGFKAGEFRDYREINQMDTRPGNQNLIILFTDMYNKLRKDTSADIVKQSGTRFLIVLYAVPPEFGNQNEPYVKEAKLFIAGPNGYSGSILNTNVTGSGPSGFDTYVAALAQLAKQPCTYKPAPVPGPGTGSGSGGTGTGNGGQGTGTAGTGAGGGSSGSTAKTQSNTPNTIPTSSAQGNNNKQPEIVPSPFFDGKQYKPGSDTDKLSGAAAATGNRLIAKWLLVVGAIVIGGAVGVGYWYWRQRARGK